MSVSYPKNREGKFSRVVWLVRSGMEKVARRMSCLICRMRVTLCVCLCVCKFRAEKQKEVFNYMCPNLKRKVTVTQ